MVYLKYSVIYNNKMTGKNCCFVNIMNWFGLHLSWVAGQSQFVNCRCFQEDSFAKLRPSPNSQLSWAVCFFLSPNTQKIEHTQQSSYMPISGYINKTRSISIVSQLIDVIIVAVIKILQESNALIAILDLTEICSFCSSLYKN